MVSPQSSKDHAKKPVPLREEPRLSRILRSESRLMFSYLCLSKDLKKKRLSYFL